MKPKLLLLAIFLSFSPFLLSAQSEAAAKLVDEGVALHDQGDYFGALAKYDEAIKMENGDYYLAGAEKATTLFFMANFEDCIEVSESLLKRYPKESSLNQVYTTLGNALDMAGKPEEAVDTYERAIGQFPNDYMLLFNLGVTYLRMGEVERGKKHLIHGANENPMHPGSHFAMGITLAGEGQRTPAIFAMLRFLMLEIGTQRSVQAYSTLEFLLEGNVEKQGRKSVSITVDPNAMKEEGAEDNYFAIDLIVDMQASMAGDKKYRKQNKGKNLVEKRTGLVKELVDAAVEMQEAGSLKGPLTDLYLPFVQELEAAGHLETAMYMAHADSGEKYVGEWLEEHFDAVKALLDWTFDLEGDEN